MLFCSLKAYDMFSWVTVEVSVMDNACNVTMRLESGCDERSQSGGLVSNDRVHAVVLGYGAGVTTAR